MASAAVDAGRAAAIAVLIPGDLVFAWEKLAGGGTAVLSASDAFYLAYFPLILAGMLVLPRVLRGAADTFKLGLDAITVAMGGGMLLWQYGVLPVVAAAHGEIGAGVMVDLAFPLGDLLTLLALATVLLRLPAGGLRLSLLLLATALVAGFALVVGVAWSDEPARLRALLPGAAILLVLVIVRQAVAQHENNLLLAAQVRRADERRFAALVQHATDAILILDTGLGVAYASPAAVRLLGSAATEPGTGLAAALHPDDAAALWEYAAACTRGQVRGATLSLRFGPPAGPWIVTEATLTNLLADPKVRGLVLNARDVSDRRALEEQLRAQSLRDPLSGLPNRELFLDRVARALARSQEGHGTMAVAVMDLDRFKLVNDGLGYRVGDGVLAQTASRIASVLTGAESVARIGGDEFGVLFEDIAGADAVMERIERLREAIANPLRVEGYSVRLSASVGVALGSGVAGTDALLRNADIALQQAQGEGGDVAELFRPDRHGREVERLALEADLPRLLESDALRIAFEPVVRVRDRRVAGLVVRVGWRDPAHAPAPIDAVLAAARVSALGPALGRWVRQALQRELGPLLRYLPDVHGMGIGLRVEAAQLKDESLLVELGAMLRKLDLAPQNLVLVVPESSFAPVTGPTAHALIRARDLGVSLVLGDFGAGHAAFAALDAFAFDGLMLAESLVARVEAGDRPAALVRAAIATGRSLRMRVLAPGVHSERQFELLRDLECELACGPHIAPPLAFEPALTWFAARFAEQRESQAG